MWTFSFQFYSPFEFIEIIRFKRLLKDFSISFRFLFNWYFNIPIYKQFFFRHVHNKNNSVEIEFFDVWIEYFKVNRYFYNHIYDVLNYQCDKDSSRCFLLKFHCNLKFHYRKTDMLLFPIEFHIEEAVYWITCTQYIFQIKHFSDISSKLNINNILGIKLFGKKKFSG